MLIEHSLFICIVYSMTIVASQLSLLHYKLSVVCNYAEVVFPTYLQVASSIGSESNATLSGRVQPATESIPSSHVPLIIPCAAPAHQLPPSVASSAPPLPIHDTNAHTSRSTNNLVTPDFFAPPPSSSTPLAPPGASVIPTAPPLHPTSASVQRSQYGAPLLQPFPPPTPPPSLTPAHSERPVVTRDRVKDALQRLVQVKLHTENMQGTVVWISIILSNSHQMPNRATSSSIWCIGNCRNHLCRLLINPSGVSGS
jgi:mRNA-decapping enzyme 1B